MFGARNLRAVVFAFWALVSTLGWCQSTVYSRLYNGMGPANTEPLLLKSDGTSSVVAGETEGSLYVRKIDHNGQEIWRTQHADVFYPLQPERLSLSTDGDVLVMCTYHAIDGYGVHALRLNGSTGTVEWAVSRRIGAYSNPFSVGGNEFNTFLLYGSDPHFRVEALDESGGSMFVHTLGHLGTVNPAADLDQQGRWVVAVKSPTSNSEIQTIAYTNTGGQTLLHTISVGTFSEVHAINAIGQDYYVTHKYPVGTYKFSNGITNWTRALPTLSDIDRIDSTSSNLFMLGTTPWVSYLAVISNETGAVVRSSLFPTRVHGTGPLENGAYGVISETGVSLLDSQFLPVWSTTIQMPSWAVRRLAVVVGGRTIIAINREQVAGGTLAERVIQLAVSDGAVLTTEFLRVVGNNSRAEAVLPTHDGSAVLITGSSAVRGGGLVALDQQGLPVLARLIGDRSVSAVPDSDGNLLVRVESDTGAKIEKVGSDGSIIFERSLDWLKGFYRGEYGSGLATISRPRATLIRFDRHGTELWSHDLYRPDVTHLLDNSNGTFYVCRDSSSFSDSTSIILDRRGRAVRKMEGDWSVAWRQDGSYYAARRSSYPLIQIELRNRAHELVWTRAIAEHNGNNSVAQLLVDRNDNLIICWTIVRSAWAAASLTPSGSLRWVSRFDGEIRRNVALARGRDLVVTGEIEVAGGIPDQACRIVSGLTGIELGRFLLTAPYMEEIEFLNTDYRGEIFAGGAGRREGERALVWRISAPGETATIAAAEALEGTLIAGGLAELSANDELRLEGRSSEGRLTLEIKSRFASNLQGELNGIVQHSCTRGGVMFELTARGSDGLWRHLTSGAADPLDSELRFWAPVQQFRDANREVHLRATWQPINDEDPSHDQWSGSLDLLGLHVTP